MVNAAGFVESVRWWREFMEGFAEGSRALGSGIRAGFLLDNYSRGRYSIRNSVLMWYSQLVLLRMALQ